nr:Hpt domain-containing protein [Pseudomonadales bacterium]
MQQDFVALQWVGGEIDEIAGQFGKAVLGFADNVSDQTRLRLGLTQAHQLHATLRLLGVPSAEQLAREIEDTVQAMLHGRIEPSGTNLQLLLAASMQLPAYLHRVAAERRESPLDVLGLVNDLRGARAEASLPAPPLADTIDTAELAQGSGASAAQADDEEVQLLRLARQRFQAGLLGVLRHEATDERLRSMGKLFALLAQRLRPGGHRLFWQACAGLTEALDQGGVALDETAVAVLRELDGELRAGIALEHGLYRRTPDAGLYRRLLELIARSRPVSPLLAAIQQRHRLTPEAAAAATPGSLDDLGATGAAVAVLAAELSAVLARLEAAEGDAFSISRVLREVEPDLRRVGQLLAGLGYQEEHEILQPQLERIQSGLVGGADLDDRLTEISAALLDVDQRLASRAVRARGEQDELAESRRHPLQRAQAAVYREVRAGLEQVKRTVGDYVTSAADTRLLDGAPQELHVLAGALRVAGLDGAAQVLGECRDHLGAVLAGLRPTPDRQAVEALADALGSVEYFLERLAADQVPAELILGRARESLARLAALPQTAEPVEAPGAPQCEVAIAATAAPLTVAQEAGAQAQQAEPAAEPPVAAEALVAPEHAVAVADPEIVEIFTEEAGEVLETIAAQLPPWRSAPGGGAPLAELRRAFHTLKGSGRMVGAGQIGELSWSVEQLLNRVIERTLEPSPAVVEAVERVHQLLPALVQAFAGGPGVDETTVHTLQSAVQAVMRGEAPQWAPTAAEAPHEPVAEELLPEAVAPEEWLPEAEAVPELAEELVAEPEPLAGQPQGQAPDPEIAAIFTEEAAEVLERIATQLPPWRAAPLAGAPLEELRRAFHTLKGSGRMVGAELVGELSWSVEHLLNRVTERALEPSPAVIEAVERVQRALPALVRAYASGESVGEAAVRTLKASVDAVARGEAPGWASAPTGFAPETPSPTPEPVCERAADEEAARLHAIFAEELAEHLRALRDYLAGEQRGTVTQLLLRTLHTLRGSALAAGNEALGLLLDAVDELVRAALEADRALHAPELEQLQHLCTLLDAVLAAGARDSAQLSADAAAMREQVLACARTEPARAPAAMLDARLARFLEEALEKLFHATTLLEAWRADRDAELSRRTLLEELQAIDQRAEQLNIAGMLQLSRPLLAALRRVAHAAMPPPAELFELARRGLDAFLEVMDRLAAGQLPEVPQAIIAQLHEAAAAEAAPESAPGPVPAPQRAGGEAEEELLRARVGRDVQHAEQELLGIFMEEAEELMGAIDESIEAWRHDRGSRAPFDDLQRHLHTLKGGARMAGLRYLGELSHNFETFLINQAVRFGAFDDAFFARVADFHEQLLRTMDVVKERPLAVPAAPVPQAAAPAPEQAEPVVPAERAASEAAPAAPLAAVPPGAVLQRPAPAVAVQPGATKPRDEVVRVSAQLLEDLVNLAAETSISRGRVEEQVSELGQLFEDMQGAIERLQSQVRRLDIATEAQVLFRRERAENAAVDGFDPLEMDRYSQLQQLSRSLVESASDLLDIKRTLAEKTRDLETVLIQQSRINSQLQEGLMSSRMVPFSSILPRLKRVVRQVAGELHKQVELELGSIAGELDRGILERVVAPLEHMLRNAVDHGIEPAELRRERGKPATGHIAIEVAREGGDVLIVVADDGGGVDLAAVRAKAIERGLMEPDAQLGDHEILQFILASGFSTAAAVTQISGRGVGMDVVSSEIRQMGGSLEIHSEPGRGTRFVVRLPFTVSVSRALLVTVGPEIHALPLNSVEGVVRMRADELRHFAGPDAAPFEYAGQSYQVRHLGAVLYPDEQPDPGSLADTVPVVLVRGGGQALAVQVDRLVGAREIAVKSLGPQFGAVPGLSGATVLGDGSVVVILDIPAMLRADAAHGATGYEHAPRGAQEHKAERPPLVMVVDDSVTVRKVTTRFLEREGMQVITAKDGADAMAKLQEQVPDVMLLDIEMPHMDGFEVVSKVRLSEQLRRIPIIMITSRTGDKHRERALSLGANMYLGKPYQESVLLEHIHALLARQGASS